MGEYSSHQPESGFNSAEHNVVPEETKATANAGTPRPAADGGPDHDEDELDQSRRAAQARATIAAAPDPAERAAAFVKEDVTPMLAKADFLYASLGKAPDSPVNDSPVNGWRSNARRYPTAVRMVAERVANHYDDSVPVNPISADQIKSMKPSLGRLSALLGQKLGGKLDTYAENRAQETIDRSAGWLIKATEYLDKVPRPREQFVTELGGIYRGMVWSGMFAGDYLLTVSERFNELRGVRPAFELPKWTRSITTDTYPMMVNAMQDFPLYPGGSIRNNHNSLNVAGQEIAEGLRAFLKHQQVTGLPEAKVPKPDTLTRELAEQFASGTLASVKGRIPRLLENVMITLPENGPEFAEKIRAFATDVAALKAEGKSDEEIGELLFGERYSMKGETKKFLRDLNPRNWRQ